MYAVSPPRRPWLQAGYCRWCPDKMVSTGNGRKTSSTGRVRSAGNDPVITRVARTKQRRLDRHLSDPDLWDER